MSIIVRFDSIEDAVDEGSDYLGIFYDGVDIYAGFNKPKIREPEFLVCSRSCLIKLTLWERVKNRMIYLWGRLKGVKNGSR